MRLPFHRQLKLRGVVPVQSKSGTAFHKVSSEVGPIPQSAKFLGKLTLQGGQYLRIPSGVREKLNLKAGDSLAIELEGKAIILKPVAEPSPDRSVKNNIFLFPPREKSQHPVHNQAEEREIDKVG